LASGSGSFVEYPVEILLSSKCRFFFVEACSFILDVCWRNALVAALVFGTLSSIRLVLTLLIVLLVSIFMSSNGLFVCSEDIFTLRSSSFPETRKKYINDMSTIILNGRKLHMWGRRRKYVLSIAAKRLQGRRLV